MPRFWPFLTRTLHETIVAAKDAQIGELTRTRDYWQRRAERLMDAALVRVGAVHEPTMVERARPTTTDPAAQIASALSLTEFDSTLKKTKGVA